MRTLRHPTVLKFLGSTEVCGVGCARLLREQVMTTMADGGCWQNETMIAMATEEVVPLHAVLQDDGATNQMGISWGILQITVS